MKPVGSIQLKVKKITYQNQQGKTGGEGQPKQVPAQPPSPGESYPQPGGMGGTGGGGQPPRKPNRDKNLPPDKIDDEEDQEEEDQIAQKLCLTPPLVRG